MLRQKNRLLLAILLLAIFLRFFQLASHPPGLYWDETSIGYNAYSILKTGQDEHGKFLPLFFKAFGEYKQPFYIYLTSFSMAIFGLSELGVRFPSAFFGTLTVLLVYFLTQEVFRKSKFKHNCSLMASLFIAISPWHLQFSRAGFEANLALFLITLASFLFLKKRLIWASTFFLLAMFTYGGAKIFIPIFLIGLFFIYYKELLAKKKLGFCFLVLIFLAPVGLSFFLPQSLARFYMVSAFVNKEISQYSQIFLKNYLSHFSLDFLFFRGDLIPRHGVGKMGNLYFFEIPLILVGLWHLLGLKDKKAKTFLLAWLLAAPVSSALTKPSPHSLRSLNMVVPLVIISSLGFWKLKAFFQKEKRAFYLFCLVSGLAIFYFFLSYLHLYWGHYPKIAGLDWQQGNKEMVEEVLQREKNYDEVAVSNFFGHPYLYVLFYGKVDPDYYLNQKTPEGFGKYVFVTDEWEKKIEEKTLFVSSYEVKEGESLLGEVGLPNGDVVYRLWSLK